MLLKKLKYTIIISQVFLVFLTQACAQHKTTSNQTSQTAFSNPVAPVGSMQLTVPSSVKPILDVWMRDAYVMYGPDGYFYLTGTTATPGRVFPNGNIHCWDYNDGLYLWRSKDMKHWSSLGRIWSFDKDAAAWQRKGKPIPAGAKSVNGDPLDSLYRAVWAPELHYVKSSKKWLMIACLNGGNGSFVLESISGKPEGPYKNIKGNEDKAIFNNIDLSLFEDTNGEVYLIGHNHYIARMNKDLSDIAEPFRTFKETPYQPEPYIEGVWLDKHHGKYQLLQTVWSVPLPDGTYTFLKDEKKTKTVYSYDVVVAEADNIYGPYGPRYPAILAGGHNNLFQDKAGNWWSTTFFNPRGLMADKFPVTCRPAVVPVKWENNKLMPDIRRANSFYAH
ncbi:family 43 glycosylhydrolase [Pedobacter sp. BS3]|uniref:family 43 glycosylhydrolase n=1 Tax=Pedobacter sp. BS3 TaxID=2567937 RepID=UPI0011ED7EC5|nr:family 43 glycosylhydrolase [Pedobacter sp. BS3]TZF82275.1 family 43 glycosylhydrolase [Pedobacter sp. BS3]